MADPVEPSDGPAARLAWFTAQRILQLRQKPPSGDITELPPPGPPEPPSLPDLMRQYRERLRNPGGTP